MSEVHRKRTTSSFYNPIKFRRKQPKLHKGQHGSNYGIKDYYRPSQAHDKSPTWRSSTLITVSHIRETGNSTKKGPHPCFLIDQHRHNRYGSRNRKIQRPTNITVYITTQSPTVPHSYTRAQIFSSI